MAQLEGWINEMANSEPGFGRVVLIVEDDPVLRMLAADVIDECGFEALEAPDGEQAISILEQRRDVELVFTDIDMPGSFDGLELASRIRDRWPPIQIVVTSGHSVPRPNKLPVGVTFLPKPYMLSRLVERLREVMH